MLRPRGGHSFRRMLSRHVTAAIAATATTALLATSAAADAATRTVHAGPPAESAAALPAGAVGNAFYPRKTTVAAGAKVAFKIGGLHNVLFAPKGTKPGPFHAPDPARPVVSDAWFNGQPGWFLDPSHLIPAGDKVIDGKALDGSGIFQGQGAPPPYEVAFPRKGSYTYLCTVHPGMKGEVRVVRKGAPSKAKHGKAIARQVAATVKSAKKLAKQVPAGNVVRAGNDRGEVAFLSFFPSTRRVHAGESVRFEMSADTTELHNVVFGPDDVLERAAAAFISIGPQGIAYDPLSVYPSAPGALTHAGGFLNTGMLDGDPRTPFPRAKAVSFTTPGRYRFICTVHGPSMSGAVEVVS
jgi:plastocyanin